MIPITQPWRLNTIMFCSNMKLVSLIDTYFFAPANENRDVLPTYLKESVRWRMNHWCRFWFDSLWLCCMSPQEVSSLSFEFSFTRCIFSQPSLTQTTLHKLRRSRLGHPGILITYTISNPLVYGPRFFSVYFSSFSVVTGLKKNYRYIFSMI